MQSNSESNSDSNLFDIRLFCYFNIKNIECKKTLEINWALEYDFKLLLLNLQT